MESKLVFSLLSAGIVAGGVNFFVKYLELPFPSKENNLNDGDPAWPKPRTLWLAILGYCIVGIAGALLTPLIHVLVGLRGYFSDKDFLVAFGYGLVFGYSTNKLLLGILGVILKKLDKIQADLNKPLPSSDPSSGPTYVTEPVDPFANPELAPTDSAGTKTNGARFGCSRVDSAGNKKWHGGLDLKAAVGTEVKAIYSGVVQAIRDNVSNTQETPGVGNFIIIKSAQLKVSIKYCHLEKVLVKVGDTITAGNVIANSGKSGNAYNVPFPHLHLEVSTDYFATAGKYVDPEPYLKTKYSPENPNDPDPSKCGGKDENEN